MLLTLLLKKQNTSVCRKLFWGISVYHRGIKHALSKTKHIKVFFFGKDATEYAKRRSHVTLMK